MAEKNKEQKEKKAKPLERWTVKELREEALKIPGLQGAHGMNKEELVAVVREAKGIVKTDTKQKGEGVRIIKTKLRQLQKQRDEERGQEASRARLTILRRKISKLKKQTRHPG